MYDTSREGSDYDIREEAVSCVQDTYFCSFKLSCAECIWKICNFGNLHMSWAILVNIDWDKFIWNLNSQRILGYTEKGKAIILINH